MTVSLKHITYFPMFRLAFLFYFKILAKCDSGELFFPVTALSSVNLIRFCPGPSCSKHR